MAKQKNEGEGNRTADREYRERTREFVESGKVSKAADDARQAVEGGEKRALREAEKKGLKRGRH